MTHTELKLQLKIIKLLETHSDDFKKIISEDIEEAIKNSLDSGEIKRLEEEKEEITRTVLFLQNYRSELSTRKMIHVVESL